MVEQLKNMETTSSSTEEFDDLMQSLVSKFLKQTLVENFNKLFINFQLDLWSPMLYLYSR